MAMYRFRLLVALLCSLLLISLPVGAQDASVPAYQPTPCPFEQPPDFTLECGTLTVPEDHFDAANSSTLSLFTVIWKAQSDTPRPDPIVMINGGPGFSSTGFPPVMMGFAPLMTERDVIFFDMRGAGHSQPTLACPLYAEFVREALGADWSVDDFNARRNTLLENCLRESGVNLEVYDRAQIAADIEALRVALGIEQINLMGFSYGNFVAQQALSDFGAQGHIRAVVMDSPPASQGEFAPGLGLQRALDAVFAACAADAACSSAYPDLPAVLASVVQQLDAEPVMLDAPDYLRGSPVPLRLDGDFFVSILMAQVTDVNRAGDIPKLIYAFKDGAYDLAPLVAADQIFITDMMWTIGEHMAARCRENILVGQASEDPVLAGFINRSLFIDALQPVCAAAEIPAAEPDRFTPVSSDVPTLIGIGALDPYALARPALPTAADLAGEFAAPLPNSTIMVVPGAGHTVSFATHNGMCVQNVMLAFFNDPSAAPDMSCLDAPEMAFQFAIE
ncbi:MAG: alpha/beta fold hydrolase [Anaerolineae bacterium]|nr:alpha/beta fold hydrolase [Anaerolineae bacterium]